jgi:hypothetical protein
LAWSDHAASKNLLGKTFHGSERRFHTRASTIAAWML